MQKNHERRQSEYFPNKIGDNIKHTPSYRKHTHEDIQKKHSIQSIGHTELSPTKKNHEQSTKKILNCKRNIFYSKYQETKADENRQYSQTFKKKKQIEKSNSMKSKEFTKQYLGYMNKKNDHHRNDDNTIEIQEGVSRKKLERKHSKDQKINQYVKARRRINFQRTNDRLQEKQILKNFEKKVQKSLNFEPSFQTQKILKNSQEKINIHKIYYISKSIQRKQNYPMKSKHSFTSNFDTKNQSTIRQTENSHNQANVEYHLNYKSNKNLGSIKILQQFHMKHTQNKEDNNKNSEQDTNLIKKLNQYSNLIQSFKKLSIMNQSSQQYIHLQKHWYYKQFLRHRQFFEWILVKLYEKVKKSKKIENVKILEQKIKIFKIQNINYSQQLKKLCKLQQSPVVNTKYNRKQILKILNNQINAIRNKIQSDQKKQKVKNLYNCITIIQNMKQNKIEKYLQDIFF